MVHHRLLRRVAAGLHADADQRVARHADPLHLDVAELERAHLLADRGEVGGWRLAPDLDDGAALEVDALVEADGEEQHEGERHQRERDRRADLRQLHERDARVVGDEAKGHVLKTYSGTVLGRVCRTQVATISRVSR